MRVGRDPRSGNRRGASARRALPQVESWARGADPAARAPLPCSREAVYWRGLRPGFFHLRSVPRSRLGEDEEEGPLTDAVPPRNC